ncbi:unnamed protein product [Miscanthus lutarioriparius]|uniref:Glycosyltransferase n=1 Tax=Miscanthus lutarioriparius TaxID=422564 RepID=A0A811R8P0_9POAL|nr:unnamed protein product [Miscanthus lutarioriparius]
MTSADPTVVLVPVWGVGHFVPMIEAGKRLLARSSRPLSLTVLILPAPTEKRASEIADHIREVEKESAGLGLAIRFHHVPAAEPPPVATYSGPEEFISLNMQPYVPHVRAAVSGLACPVAALVVDIFCTPLLDAAHGLGVPAYVYLICSAAMCALLLRSPALDEEAAAAGDVEFEEMDGGAVHVPGLPPVPASCLPSGLVDRKVPTYRWFLYNGRRYPEAAGIIVNTVAELEPHVLAAIADGRCTRGNRAPTVYAVGPVLAATITAPPPADAGQQQEEHECVRWLDTQPPASVLFLCFGSARFFTARQAHETAHALDRSGHRFLWVLRGPPEHGTKLSSDGDLAELLPPGFSEKTKGRGLVWPKWAPQKEILAHAAVGGFVTHCGWNSVLESLWFGVPMLTWPWAAEQHYNAFTLVSGMGVAVAMEVRRKEDNFVEAAEMERAVRALMGGAEGSTAREKAREMKAACRRAVEEGGSSYASLQRLCDALHQGAVLPTKFPQNT